MALTVCIDTNVVLGLFTVGHPHRPLFEAWFNGQLNWALSTDTLFEYEEVLQRQGSAAKAEMMKRIMQLVHTLHGNCPRISPTFRFGLIVGAPDDNKFADCAIAAEADFIITSDRHFDILRGSGYNPQPIGPESFIEQYLAP